MSAQSTSIVPSARLSQLSTYIFAEIAQLKRAYDPEALIDLSLGSPDSSTPEPVLATIANAMRTASNHGYPPFDGKMSLRVAIAQWFQHRFGVCVQPTNILPLIGSKEGLAHLPLAYIDSGDVALIPDPHYPVHMRGSQIAGADIITMPLLESNRFLPDLNSISSEHLDRAKMMILNYPNNPTGAIATDELWNDAVRVARKHNILLVSDLAYSEMGFNGHTPRSVFEFMSLEEQAIEFFTFSKTYHMAGWRIGFAIGNSQIINNLYSIKSNMDYGVSGTVQDAAVAALAMPYTYYDELRKLYQSRAEYLYEGIVGKLGWSVHRPQGAMYVWVKVPPAYDGDGTVFAKDLLLKCGVVCTPGVAFGKLGSDRVRFALVQPIERLAEAIERMQGFSH